MFITLARLHCNSQLVLSELCLFYKEEVFLAMSMSAISIVDLGKLGDIDKISDSSEWHIAAKQIREGLGNIGFLYLVNHGIPSETIDNVLRLCQEFFSLPPTVKEKYRKNTRSKDDPVFNLKEHSGFMPVAGEKLNLDKRIKAELKETFDWVKPTYATHPSEELPHFRDCLIQLDKESKRVYKRLLKLLALALKLEDEDFFVKTCRYFDEPEDYEGLWNIRLLHYPRIENASEAAAGMVRCGEHTDYGFLTILIQDDTGGLEVQTVDGQWVEAKPIPGAVLLNTGDLTEFWTSGIFPATMHRIRIPNLDQEERMKDRYSIAVFLGPDTTTIITPMDLEKREEEKRRLERNGKVYEKKPISAHDHFMGRIATLYR